MARLTIDWTGPCFALKEKLEKELFSCSGCVHENEQSKLYFCNDCRRHYEDKYVGGEA